MRLEVAGDEAIDDGRPWIIIGKSAILKLGAAAGLLGTTYLSTGGGTLVTADGALLCTAFGLDDGGTFSAGRLLTGTAVAAFGSALADPAEPPVIFASSSSSSSSSSSIEFPQQFGGIRARGLCRWSGESQH